MTFNPKPALIMSTVFSLPVPNTDKNSDSEGRITVISDVYVEENVEDVIYVLIVV